MFFRFLNPGPLTDGELELVPPGPGLVDEVLLATAHPLTQRDMPREGGTTRHDLLQVIDAWPGGHQPGRSLDGTVPTYHFWMRVTAPVAPAVFDRDAVVAGMIGLRVGRSRDVELYYGHVGYHVYPPLRGHHYAERAVRLLLPLAVRHGLTDLWITCNPDNLPSRRTCERLGGELTEILDVPPGHPLYLRGERQKCRYRIRL
jgi:tagatose 1,6-diphosphate aldolase